MQPCRPALPAAHAGQLWRSEAFTAHTAGLRSLCSRCCVLLPSGPCIQPPGLPRRVVHDGGEAGEGKPGRGRGRGRGGGGGGRGRGRGRRKAEGMLMMAAVSAVLACVTCRRRCAQFSGHVLWMLSTPLPPRLLDMR